VRTIDTGITNAFGGSLFTAAADYDLDYQDDVIYIGYTKSEDAKPTATTQWTEGGVIRLVTGEDRTGTASAWANTALNPDKWAWSHVIENTGSTTSGVTHLTSYSTKKEKPYRPAGSFSARADTSSRVMTVSASADCTA